MRVGIDVGGTFTDLVLWDEQASRRVVHKVPSTTPSPADGVIQGLRELADRAGLDSLAVVDQVVHGTTVATNLLLERDGAHTGMITTAGFRDLLHIARKKRPYNFSSYLDLPWQANPLIRRADRMTVQERIGLPSGEIVEPLAEQEVREAARRLAERGVESVAICFLGSFVNAAHELRAHEIVREELPDAFVSTSHEVSAMYREYERFNTAAVNCYVGPATVAYLSTLDERLAELGVTAGLRLMTSAGGVVSSEEAQQQPVGLLMSGPAAGLIAGSTIGEAVDAENVMTLDVGGTSSDIGLIADGSVNTKHLLDTQVCDQSVMVPMVDVETIGAGGGSIASVSDQGILAVGPRSAGSDPGPACYGLGGKQATATDAFVTLGWIRPTSSLAGRLSLDEGAARSAIEEHVAEPLDLSVEEAALGVHRLLVNNTAARIRLVSERKGHDPRDFALVAQGGAGPLIGAAVADVVGLSRVIVPRHPGLASAAGLLSTELKYEFASTIWSGGTQEDVAGIADALSSLRDRARAALDADGIAEDRRRLEMFCDCRYDGQGYELRVRAPEPPIDDAWMETVIERFHREHELTYDRRFDDAAVTVVNVRVTGVGEVPRPPAGSSAGRISAEQADAAVVDKTRMWFQRSAATPEAVVAPVYDRSRLRVGASVDGPAVVEQQDSTVVIPPTAGARVSHGGTLLIDLAEQENTTP